MFTAQIYYSYLAPRIQGNGYASHLIESFEIEVTERALACEARHIRLVVDIEPCTEQYNPFWMKYGFKLFAAAADGNHSHNQLVKEFQV